MKNPFEKPPQESLGDPPRNPIPQKPPIEPVRLGIPLRDYFAGQYLMGRLAQGQRPEKLDWPTFAKAAYRAADQFMTVRALPPEELET